MRRVAFIAVALFLVLAGTAQAAPRAPFHELMVKGEWQLRVAEIPGWRDIEVRQIRNLPGAWGYYLATDQDCTFDQGTDGVYREGCKVKSGRIELELGLERIFRYTTLAHEYGHAFSHMVMTEEQRTRFLTVMGIDRGWWDDPPGERVTSPEELFADAYSWCSLRFKDRRELGVWFDEETGLWPATDYGLEMSRPQARAVCGMLR